jgi:hypothetical protein
VHPPVNLEAKNHLARLLATENIFIRHKQVKTASFDTVSRVLTFPIWKDVSHVVYTMLAGHEVGHALWTVRESLNALAKRIDPKFINIAAAYINIVEDVRIEKLIKAMYPGLRQVFLIAYQELDKKFKITSNIDGACFIDRANVFYKFGHETSFTTVEKDFVDRMEKTETSNDVFELADEIYKWAKQNDQHPDAPELPEDLIEQLKEALENGDIDLEESDGPSTGPQIEIEMECEGEGDESEGNEGGQGKGQEKDKKDGSDDSDKKDKSKGDGSKEKGKDGEDGDGEDGEGNESEGKDSKPPTSQKQGKPAAVPPNNKKAIPVKPRSAPAPLTQQRFDESIVKLNDTKARDIIYLSTPKPNLKNIVEDYKTVHQAIRDNLKLASQATAMTRAIREYEDFCQVNNDKINYIFTQFEMKKQAERYKRIKTSKTGSIDTLRLHAYKYEEDLFKSIANVTDAKNHGLIYVVDWSASMSSSMPGTLQQLIILAKFCRKAQIPFEVYSLTTGDSSQSFEIKPGNLCYTKNFRMRNYLSSRMNQKEFHDACVNLFALMPGGLYNGFKNRQDQLIGCTPLDEAVITAVELIKELRARTKAQIVNAIFLTDGGANTVSQYVNDYGRTEYMTGDRRYIIEDRLTRKHYEFSCGWNEMTPAMLQILRDRENINVLGFYVTESLNEYMFSLSPEDKKQFDSDGYVICTNWGFNELYVLKGGERLKATEVALKARRNGSNLEPGQTMYVEEITKSLAARGIATRKNRVMLDRFVRMIA